MIYSPPPQQKLQGKQRSGAGPALEQWFPKWGSCPSPELLARHVPRPSRGSWGQVLWGQLAARGLAPAEAPLAARATTAYMANIAMKGLDPCTAAPPPGRSPPHGSTGTWCQEALLACTALESEFPSIQGQERPLSPSLPGSLDPAQRRGLLGRLCPDGTGRNSLAAQTGGGPR